MSEWSDMIVVDQPDALMDVPVAVELKEFTPHQAVTVTATQIFPSNSRWQAHATFMRRRRRATGADIGQLRRRRCDGIDLVCGTRVTPEPAVSRRLGSATLVYPF
jgi:hypothetical protein